MYYLNMKKEIKIDYKKNATGNNYKNDGKVVDY